MSAEGVTYRPTENDGQKIDGGKDERLSSEHGFGGDREFASEMGKKGGKKGGETSDLAPDAQLKNDGDFNPDAPQV